MLGLSKVRRRIGDYLWLRALEKHYSRMGRKEAPRYTRYLERARQNFAGPSEMPPELDGKVEEFLERGFTSFWTPTLGRLAGEVMDVVRAEEEERGPALWNDLMRYTGGEIYTKFPQIEAMLRHAIGPFAENVYRSHYKIFYGLMYKSQRKKNERRDSQIWHADGGPGTCINIMLTFVDTTPANGAMECLPWQESLQLFRNERKVLQRGINYSGPSDVPERERVNYVRAKYYGDEIEKSLKNRVVQMTGKAGLVLAFRNNNLHRGGFVEPGQTRYVSVLHLYPSIGPTPYERYRRVGIPKSQGVPRGPEFGDDEANPPAAH
jgi:hypothetical protein